MINNKIKRVTSLFMTMLILSMAFTAAVSAQVSDPLIDQKMEEQLEKLTSMTKDMKIKCVTDTSAQKEYYITVNENGKDKTYYSKHWQEQIDGKQVWKVSIYDVTNGSKIVDTKSSLVKDSYYWKDSSGGLHVHIGPVDNAFVIGGSSGAISLVASLLRVEGAGTVAAALVLIIIVVDQYECNKDGSLDIYISKSQLKLIPAYIITPGLQIISVKIGKHYYSLPI